MMDRTLSKILTKRKPSFILSASLLIAGIYVGFLVWYVLDSYIPGSFQMHCYYLSMIVMGVGTFAAVYQIPDLLFANEQIAYTLSLPIDTDKIICILLKRIIYVQTEICAVAYWPCFFFHSENWKITLLVMLYSLMVIILCDLLVFLLSVAIGTIAPHQYVGYIFLVLQFAGPIGLLFAVGKGITLLPYMKNIFVHLLLSGSFLGIAITILAIFHFKMCFNHYYTIAYMNMQRFQHKESCTRNKVSHIRNPYFFLEWKRITRNKALIFFSNIKNIITILLLSGILSKSLMRADLLIPDQLELLLLVSCASINTISSTAYSSDENRAFYGFLPISPRKMFFWKTFQGFLWGEATVLLFWTGIIVFRTVSIVDAILFLLYGTLMNYACVWLGVLFDHKMPRRTSSTNELLHGNLSKFFVLIIALVLTVLEVQLWEKHCNGISLLLFVTLGSAVLILFEIGYSYIQGGDLYDTNR